MTRHLTRLTNDQSYYQTIKITVRFSESSYTALRYRAIKHASSPDGYIKKLLNRQIQANQLPPSQAFIRHFPTTKSHPAEHISLTTSYPAMYLRYLDTLAANLPAHYGTGHKSRRRLIETLTLIDLFDTGA